MGKINWKELTQAELDKVAILVEVYPWENKEAYTDFISNMYYFLAQACRLLTAAASRCDVSQDAYFHRFVDHTLEEKNHEKLVLTDLKFLGEKLRPMMACMPALWQTQFYMIQNRDPLALFGCVLYLENLSLHPEIGPGVYERVLPVYGNKCTNYLRVHVKEDGDHIEKLFAALDQLPESSQAAVLESLNTTSVSYLNFFRDLSERHKVQWWKKSAA